MVLRDAFLTIHIAAGSTGLVLGPVAMLSPKWGGHRHMRAGELYHWVMLCVCLSAAGLAILAWGRIWWFLPIAAFSYANALYGYLAAKRRGPGWLKRHIQGMGGSYIALLTALLVVNTHGKVLLAWFIPTLIGTPLLRVIVGQVQQGRRPKRARPAVSLSPGDSGPGQLH